MTQLVNHRYHIVRVLARGGFSQTFLAEDTHMPSRPQCVLKQLQPPTPDPHLQAEIQTRFQREAAILEMLSQRTSGIPKLYAYFVEQNQYYLVQELIQGQTLKDWIQTAGAQDEVTVKTLLIHILPILAQVHESGIIHRDIKPDNIMLRDQMPVLIDFGAVKEVVGTVIASEGQVASTVVIGTPGFMAPEQAKGHPLPVSDLYSLGLTAIYLLTGQSPLELPFDAQTGELQWQTAAPHLSPGFAAVLNQAIQYYPRDRIPSATAFRQALQSLPETGQHANPSIPPTLVADTLDPQIPATDVVTPTPPRERSRSAPVALLLIGAVILIGGLGFLIAQVNPLIEQWISSLDETPSIDPSPDPDAPTTPALLTTNPWFGAIAYSPSTRSYGYSLEYPDAEIAANQALQSCTDYAGTNDCRLLVDFQDSCGALAVSSTGAYGSGFGPTHEGVDEAAISVCEQYGGTDCSITLRVCPDGVFQAD